MYRTYGTYTTKYEADIIARKLRGEGNKVKILKERERFYKVLIKTEFGIFGA